VITLGFVALFQFHEPTRKFTWKYPWLMFVALGVLLVTMISMACCTNVRRKAPMNYIFLLIFTLAESFLLGMATSVYRLDEVFLAVGITAAVCFALTLFAFQTK
jgi:FtsH-binding integral membrane protein